MVSYEVASAVNYAGYRAASYTEMGTGARGFAAEEAGVSGEHLISGVTHSGSISRAAEYLDFDDFSTLSEEDAEYETFGTLFAWTKVSYSFEDGYHIRNTEGIAEIHGVDAGFLYSAGSTLTATAQDDAWQTLNSGASQLGPKQSLTTLRSYTFGTAATTQQATTSTTRLQSVPTTSVSGTETVLASTTRTVSALALSTRQAASRATTSQTTTYVTEIGRAQFVQTVWEPFGGSAPIASEEAALGLGLITFRSTSQLEADTFWSTLPRMGDPNDLGPGEVVPGGQITFTTSAEGASASSLKTTTTTTGKQLTVGTAGPRVGGSGGIYITGSVPTFTAQKTTSTVEAFSDSVSSTATEYVLVSSNPSFLVTAGVSLAVFSTEEKEFWRSDAYSGTTTYEGDVPVGAGAAAAHFTATEYKETPLAVRPMLVQEVGDQYIQHQARKIELACAASNQSGGEYDGSVQGFEFFPFTHSAILPAAGKATVNGIAYTYSGNSSTAQFTNGSEDSGVFGVAGDSTSYWQVAGAGGPQISALPNTPKEAVWLGGAWAGEAVLPAGRYYISASSSSALTMFSQPTKYVWASNNSNVTAFIRLPRYYLPESSGVASTLTRWTKQPIDD